MADIDDCNAYMTSAGYLDWAALPPPTRSAMLVRADTYIRTRYRLRTNLTDDETATVALARWLIARDMAVNGTPIADRNTPNIERQTVQGAGFEKSTQYAVSTQLVDPYPWITSMLATLVVKVSVVNFFSASPACPPPPANSSIAPGGTTGS